MKETREETCILSILFKQLKKKNSSAITLLLSFSSCNAQMKNAKTETVKIYGNCGMCMFEVLAIPKKQRTANRRLSKVAVQYSEDCFVINQTFVLRINICGKNRHLRQAPKRCKQFLPLRKKN
jgi:hypothetical protein